MLGAQAGLDLLHAEPRAGLADLAVEAALGHLHQVLARLELRLSLRRLACEAVALGGQLLASCLGCLHLPLELLLDRLLGSDAWALYGFNGIAQPLLLFVVSGYLMFLTHRASAAGWLR